MCVPRRGQKGLAACCSQRVDTLGGVTMKKHRLATMHGDEGHQGQGRTRSTFLFGTCNSLTPPIRQDGRFHRCLWCRKEERAFVALRQDSLHVIFSVRARMVGGESNLGDFAQATGTSSSGNRTIFVTLPPGNRAATAHSNISSDFALTYHICTGGSAICLESVGLLNDRPARSLAFLLKLGEGVV